MLKAAGSEVGILIPSLHLRTRGRLTTDTTIIVRRDGNQAGSPRITRESPPSSAQHISSRSWRGVGVKSSPLLADDVTWRRDDKLWIFIRRSAQWHGGWRQFGTYHRRRRTHCELPSNIGEMSARTSTNIWASATSFEGDRTALEGEAREGQGGCHRLQARAFVIARQCLLQTKLRTQGPICARTITMLHNQSTRNGDEFCG